MNALITITNGLINFYRKQIVELAKKNRLASMFEASSWVKARWTRYRIQLTILRARRAAAMLTNYQRRQASRPTC